MLNYLSVIHHESPLSEKILHVTMSVDYWESGMKETMWSRGAISATVSTLGTPLEEKRLLSPWGHALRACVMLEFIRQIPQTIPVLFLKWKGIKGLPQG